MTQRSSRLLERGWLLTVLALGVVVSLLSLASTVQGWVSGQDVTCVAANP